MGIIYKTTRGNRLFDKNSTDPFLISRTKLDLFCECERCAYLDLKLGVKRPSGPSFTLNNAVDELLKREFDIHRENGTIHPLLKEYGLDAIPLSHESLDEWRDSLRRGISYLHEPSNIRLRGGIDDLWQNKNGEVIVVDYKATSKKVGPAGVDDLYGSYKRQMEIYQWLFRRNGFPVHPAGYFVYVNGKSDAKAFDAKIEFDVKLISYTGDDSWIEPKLIKLKEILMAEKIPEVGTSFGGGPCDFCSYRTAAGEAIKKMSAEEKIKFRSKYERQHLH